MDFVKSLSCLVLPSGSREVMAGISQCGVSCFLVRWVFGAVGLAEEKGRAG